MNWKLIITLSLFALGMALATVFLIPSKIEPLFWLPIFVICAVVIARKQPARAFVHGLLLGIVNCVWITLFHIVFFRTYLAAHAREAAMMRSMPLADSPRLMMALTGPVIGVVSGAVIGLLAMLAGKLMRNGKKLGVPQLP
jgi:hypothetical protein